MIRRGHPRRPRSGPSRFSRTTSQPEQRSQYERHGYFDVIGGATRRRYRIRHGTQMNVQLLDSSGRWVSSLCFAPRGRLPVGDVMLAQAIALQLFEYEALNVANGRLARYMASLPAACDRSGS